ncbi:hypothetical protein TNCV_2926221 [Trichonephila clavipes]|nr:hypothetical protein TNCV_2926221 [Trichonephila clavipes]
MKVLKANARSEHIAPEEDVIKRHSSSETHSLNADWHLRTAKDAHLLTDNALVPSSNSAVEELMQCDFEILPHPPYTPDLTPIDFFLITELQKPLCGRKFGNSNGVIQKEE